MKPYPLVFELEETMTRNSFGKTAREYRLPTKLTQVLGRKHQVELASLHNGSQSIELHVHLEKKPGNSFQEGRYFIRFTGPIEKTGRFLDENTTFSSPEELKVFLSHQLREYDILPETFNHALEYVDVFYPHMTAKLENEIQDFWYKTLRVHLNPNGYMVEKVKYPGRIGFVVHAVDSTFRSKQNYSTFKQIVEDTKMKLLSKVKDITLLYRLNKGLKDIGISWSINRKHYAIMSKIERIEVNMRPSITDGEEIISITSKGITLSIEAAKSFNKEDMDYTVWVKENGIKPKKLRVTFYSDDLDKHILMLKKIFLEIFNDGLDNLHFIVKQCRTFSKSLETWTQKQFEPIANDIAGAFTFNLYGIKTATSDKLPESHRLIFLSTSELLTQKGMSEAVANLMEETLINQ